MTLPQNLEPMPLDAAQKRALAVHARGVSQAYLRGHIAKDIVAMAIHLTADNVMRARGRHV
jgi:hypothetical protein